MSRILKPGPRPFIVFGVMCGLFLIVPLAMVIVLGPSLEAAKFTGCIVGFYVLLCVILSLPRLVITSDSITYRPMFEIGRRIMFHAISGSRAIVLAEPEHPVALEIYVEGVTGTVLTIALKPFRQKDVAWLLSLPELKVQGS